MKIQSEKDLEKIGTAYQSGLYYPEKLKVNIGMASCGIAAGAQKALAKAAAAYGNGDGVQICQTGCLGFCEQEPLVEILAKGQPRVLYKKMTADRILDAIEDYRSGALQQKKWILGQIHDPRCLLEEDIDNPLGRVEPYEGIPLLDGTSFYSKQLKIALRNCGYIDPDSIEEYIARAGYRAFLRALNELKPAEVISAVKTSGLRGRGGGGFPTGIKWATCAKHEGRRAIICNADEGDPEA